MARKGAGPRPSVGKLTGKSAKGSRGGGKAAGRNAPTTVNTVNPAATGNADVVQERAAQAGQGKMEQKQLAKNKSTGLNAKRR